MMNCLIRRLPFTAVCVCVVGCTSNLPRIGEHPYVPLYAAHADATKTDALDPRDGDWHWAGTATTFREAASRWQAYLQKHYAQNDLEDGTDFYKRETAAYELMRIYYLLGDWKKGDEILRSRDPLNLLENPERPVQ